jgi:hypothetical protein
MNYEKKEMNFDKIEKVIFHGKNNESQLLRNAHQFRLSYKIIKDLIEEGSERRYLDLIPACIIILAFSCELQLKTIIRLESNSISQGHSFEKLFEKLTPESQSKIIDHVDEKMKKKNGYIFQEYLKKCSMAFVDWRYLHEDYRELNLMFLDIFGDGIEIRLNDVHKEKRRS